jgi:putative flippase GtrA
MLKYINNFIIKHTHLILYIIIGSFAFFIDNLFFKIIFDAKFNYFISNIISVHLGVITSFCCNIKFNYKIKRNLKFRFVSFYFISFIGLFVSSVFLFLFINYLQINPFYSKIISSSIAAILQYLLNSYFSFKEMIILNK